MTEMIGQDQASGRKRWLPTLARAAIGRIRERIEVWRMTRRLLAADDTMLKDIGISRGDVEWVVRHGRWPDRFRSPK